MPSVSSRSRLTFAPMTAAALRVRLAAGSSRSMRAAMVACTVAGMLTSAHIGRRDVAARLSLQHTALGQVAHDLLGEKRVPGGPFDDQGGQPGHRGVRPDQFADQRAGLRIAQRGQGDGLRTLTRLRRPRVLGAVGDQDQRGGLRDHGEEVGQHRLADLVDPVRVLDDVDRRGLPGPARRC